MNFSRFTPARLAGGLLLAAALFGCESMGPVAVPGELQNTRLNVVVDQVAQAEKDRAAQGRAPTLGTSVTPQNDLYVAEQIPFVAGPTGLANEAAVGDDVVQNDVPIGFNFTFYGNTYSTLQVSSNGFLRFAPANNNSGCCAGRVIPLDDLWNNIIAFAWTDLNPSGALGGRLRYETRGDAPNRRFILHADDVRYFGGTETNLIQWVILHEGSNVIEIHTQTMTPRVITQGIENATGTNASFIPGRVATTFSLTNDGVRFTPVQITEVPVSRIYSNGREGNSVSLNDDDLFVEILNVEQYIPRAGVVAGQVRIGPSWAQGTPAQGFQILDINNDGNRDIRLRFSVDQLIANGHLGQGTTQLMVWGQDNGQFYRGMGNVTIVMPGSVLYSNGPWITHPGEGAGGANVHMAATNFLASNVRRIGADPHFRIADRFEVTGGPWTVNMIVTRALINDLPTPNWNFYSANIWDGVPGAAGSNIVATTSSASFAWANAYAVFQGEPVGGTALPVFNIYWNTPGLSLANGTYWVDWQVDGSNAWAIYTTQRNEANPNQPILVQGVGRQLTPTGWQNLLAGEAVPFTPGTPFEVIGTSAGGTGLPAFLMPAQGRPATRVQPGAAAPGTQQHLRRQ